MINIFIEKQYTKNGGEASQRPFYKRSKSLHQYSRNVTQSVYTLHPSRGLSKHIKNKVLTSCFGLI